MEFLDSFGPTPRAETFRLQITDNKVFRKQVADNKVGYRAKESSFRMMQLFLACGEDSQI